MNMIMQTSMSGPDLQLVKGQSYDATPIEAVRLHLARFANVAPEDQAEFEAALAAYEAAAGAPDAPSDAHEADSQAAVDAKAEAAKTTTAKK